ncbi:MAG: hypothetical protein K0R44_738 [Thermomicrobiales bacterium]|jgi:hypothetical protein|nr:hypothetical protein [Thermomicrobiales bacterium]MDF2747536.1 hypothetical protein [Propionibacteriaceae bacterium]MDF3015513.1 hypothetical protein [Thermomicrobiales bacterium]
MVVLPGPELAKELVGRGEFTAGEPVAARIALQRAAQLVRAGFGADEDNESRRQHRLYLSGRLILQDQPLKPALSRPFVDQVGRHALR